MSVGKLRRSVGFYGLMFVSLGSIIGSGWLLGALHAVFIPSIEVLAALTYINSVGWVHDHFNMLTADGLLNGLGLLMAVLMMAMFTAINLAGAKFLSDSNAAVVIWKAAVPLLACAGVAGTHFDTKNFHRGGGFLPFGWHGVFAALTGGIVFSLQGFEQAVQLAGEARNTQRDLSRAVITAMAIGAVLYSLLQLVFIGGLEPSDILHGWSNPLGTMPGAYGAWYTHALAHGIGWHAKALLLDAIISPTGTGVVYVGTSARLSYALGEEKEIPSKLASTNKHGVPVFSIGVAFVVGCVAFGPFKSWNQLVSVVPSATAIMYGFAPVALAALRRLAHDRPRTYRMPA